MSLDAISSWVTGQKTTWPLGGASGETGGRGLVCASLPGRCNTAILAVADCGHARMKTGIGVTAKQQPQAALGKSARNDLRVSMV